MLEFYAPKLQTSGTYTGKAFGYVPGNLVQWEIKTFAGDTIDINKEIHCDDVLTADLSQSNTMYSLNGTRLSFGYIPFYILNNDTVEVFDFGYKLYDSPSSVRGDTNGQNLASLAQTSQDASRSDVSRKFEGFQLGNTGIFIRGKASAANLNTVRDLSSAYWTNVSSPGYLTSVSNDYPASTTRMIISADSFVQAAAWSDAAPYLTKSFTDGDLTVSGYGIKKWNAGSRASFISDGAIITASTSIDDVIRIPAGGCVFGYFIMAVTNNRTTTSHITMGESGYSIIAHGNWTGQDLIASNAANGVFMHTIARPWDAAGGINTRLFRYGIHVVGRKVNT